MITRPEIDQGCPFDWGKTSPDYAVYRPGYPASFYAILQAVGIGQPGQHILDLGTGTGVLARAFARQGAHVTGIDIAAEQIAAAEFTIWHQLSLRASTPLEDADTVLASSL